MSVLASGHISTSSFFSSSSPLFLDSASTRAAESITWPTIYAGISCPRLVPEMTSLNRLERLRSFTPVYLLSGPH
ncbi:hypothetical protein FA15DRAFT_665505 [Coprinopsis marcescibilis]|uniref:Uncharacterized protein n=1 Tax=Coprinopsis marcescibilis TaxID=230819 RepID=A0A5C3L6I8_COPMA|nr:hypothetical protein FA15DRAFT_665505 [Coprinopsis marcescibilis]